MLEFKMGALPSHRILRTEGDWDPRDARSYLVAALSYSHKDDEEALDLLMAKPTGTGEGGGVPFGALLAESLWDLTRAACERRAAAAHPSLSDRSWAKACADGFMMRGLEMDLLDERAKTRGGFWRVGDQAGRARIRSYVFEDGSESDMERHSMFGCLVRESRWDPVALLPAEPEDDLFDMTGTHAREPARPARPEEALGVPGDGRPDPTDAPSADTARRGVDAGLADGSKPAIPLEVLEEDARERHAIQAAQPDVEAGNLEEAVAAAKATAAPAKGRDEEPGEVLFENKAGATLFAAAGTFCENCGEDFSTEDPGVNSKDHGGMIHRRHLHEGEMVAALAKVKGRFEAAEAEGNLCTATIRLVGKRGAIACLVCMKPLNKGDAYFAPGKTTSRTRVHVDCYPKLRVGVAP